jgi:hypothetical protein
MKPQNAKQTKLETRSGLDGVSPHLDGGWIDGRRAKAEREYDEIKIKPKT